MINNFIYYKSLRSDKSVNSALVNDLHSDFDDFPDPLKNYGLLTIKDRKTRIKIFGKDKKG